MSIVDMPRHSYSKSRSKRRRSPSYSWGWLIIGILSGIAGSSMIFWWAKSPKVVPTPPLTALKKIESKPTTIANTQNKNFDFYTLLPNMEVSVSPAAPSTNVNHTPVHTATPSLPPSDITKQPVTKTHEKKPLSPAIETVAPTKISHNHIKHYMIHLNPLTELSAADALKARLILQNFKAHIKKIQLPNKQISFQVTIGPFPNLTMAEQQKKRLEICKIYGSLIVTQPDNHP